MNFPKIAVLCMVATAIASCGSFDNRPLTGLPVSAADTRAGSAVILAQKCPVTGKSEFAFVPLIVGALAPLVANFAVNVVGDLVKSEKEGLSGRFVAGTASTGLYRKNKQLSFSCLIIVRGVFGATSPTGASGDEGLTSNDLKALHLADYPAFYLEADASLDGESLVFQPRYIRYAQSSARRAGSGRKHVGIVLALTEAVLKPDADPTDDKAIALFRFDLGRLEIGKSYRHTDGSPLLTGTAAQQSVPALGGKDGLVPFNALAIVTETEDAGLLLEALDAAITSKRGDLEKGIVDIIKKAFPEEEKK